MMGKALMRFTPEFILSFFQSGKRTWTQKVTSDALPDDVKIISAWYDPEKDLLYLGLKSEEFPHESDYGMLPKPEIRFYCEDTE